MNKKLSLCLTTYNRKEELNSTLFNLCKLCASKYEVIILDASDEPITQNKLPNHIKYKHLPGKRSLSLDYISAYDMCEGHYVMFITDDDYLPIKTIDSIYNALTDNSDLVVIPHKLFSLEGLLISQQDFSEYADKFLLKNIPKALIQHLSHIGSFAFKRDCWHLEYTHISKKNYFPHFFPIFNEHNLHKSIKILPNDFIEINLGNASWKDKTSFIWINQWGEVQEFLELNKINSINFLSIKRLLMLCVITNKNSVLYSLKNKSKYLYLIIFFIPQKFLRFLYKIYLHLISKDPYKIYTYKINTK